MARLERPKIPALVPTFTVPSSSRDPLRAKPNTVPTRPDNSAVGAKLDKRGDAPAI